MFRVWYRLPAATLLLSALAAPPAAGDGEARTRFTEAWNAASRGDHEVFTRLPASLADYELFPYLVYEDLRHNRGRVQPAVIADFLARHADWAFAKGLRRAWLKTLGKQERWADILRYADGDPDTEVRCYRARAALETGRSDGLLEEARALWTAGRSQPKACDPLFAWLIESGGITPDLAWERIRLAMAGGEPRLTLYLARFVPPRDREWLGRWQEIERRGYRDLHRTATWPDEELTRMITAVSLRRLARRDAGAAWRAWSRLEGHFGWPAAIRGAILRDIALNSAVGLEEQALDIMAAVPPDFRDEQLLQWWARAALASGEWQTLQSVIGQMAPDTRSDGRWRFWQAVALEQLGEAGAAREIRDRLSRESSYYGFLAADALGLPYSICPAEPLVSEQAVTSLRARADFSRALELRAVGLENWALAEWSLAAARLDREGLRAAAALAREEGWHDRVIFSLGDSGDLQYYEWRFPLPWEDLVSAESSRNALEPSWVFGVMRSESALAEQARSSAGALGLMQVTPATARRLARQHGLAYHGSDQLRQAAPNIRFGTRFMRELLDRYGQNPVLVAGAYNAGPQVVDRWLEERPRGSAAAWVETIPYFETRDYIPRVLAFTAIYEWRMQQQVTRVSSRMPDLDSGNMGGRETTEVVCFAPG